MRDGVGLELEHAFAVELADLVPGQERRLFPVPRERRPPVRHPRRDENGRAEAELCEYRQRILGDVPVAVVEAEADRAARNLSCGQETAEGGHVDDGAALIGEKVHVPAEPVRRNRELVGVVGDPVVHEDSWGARGREHRRFGRAMQPSGRV